MSTSRHDDELLALVGMTGEQAERDAALAEDETTPDRPSSTSFRYRHAGHFASHGMGAPCDAPVKTLEYQGFDHCVTRNGCTM
ncbi:hypothetical protein Uis1B_1583 [Bifidobacterium margollesii]|uniref:Uncharacterized protein n=1 Tax=Bifidobacterium margollesii TaxID=2020964 RepID=A0A2N5J8T1_9BIFI|nr:hypothetical protein [Bifidobacterium margollesii]PLS30595.1 hypothetical protein Uis1B_1583 [Bifidobacterium margollesii]